MLKDKCYICGAKAVWDLSTMEGYPKDKGPVSVCTQCMIVGVHHPDAVAARDSDEEYEDFREAGGMPS
jgi:hypothetical protein